MKPCILYLTCANDLEADKIVDILLEKKLIVCAKKLTVQTKNYWKGKIESAREVLLIMDSSEELFSKVEGEVRELHSYDTFNLMSSPVTHLSTGIKEWMSQGLVQ